MLVVTLASCARQEAPPVPKTLEFGAHRLLVTVPEKWELLDQGSQKRFRKSESEIVLRNLGRIPPELKTLDALADRALEAIGSPGDKERREVKSRTTILIDGHEAMEVETWSRLDHTYPQRLICIPAGDQLLALHTVRMADAETLEAFDAIRDSLHFGPAGIARR
jgi:hypothetical protein